MDLIVRLWNVLEDINHGNHGEVGFSLAGIVGDAIEAIEQLRAQVQMLGKEPVA